MKQYTKEFKIKVVEEYLQSLKNVHRIDICKKYDIKLTTFKSWLRSYKNVKGTIPFIEKKVRGKANKNEYFIDGNSIVLTKKFYDDIIDKESFEKLKDIYCNN